MREVWACVSRQGCGPSSRPRPPPARHVEGDKAVVSGRRRATQPRGKKGFGKIRGWRGSVSWTRNCQSGAGTGVRTGLTGGPGRQAQWMNGVPRSGSTKFWLRGCSSEGCPARLAKSGRFASISPFSRQRERVGCRSGMRTAEMQLMS